jgi:hypothetical protein
MKAQRREGDLELLAKMRNDPLGTIRTLAERMAFERDWDLRFEQGLARARATDDSTDATPMPRGWRKRLPG